jgi:hypothetical protein
LDRAVTPTVLKHQGRIQVTKGETQSSKIIQSPMSMKSGNFIVCTLSDLILRFDFKYLSLILGARSKGNSVMEVSVLEKMGSTKSNIPTRRPFNK